MPDKENFNAVIETLSGEYGVCQYGECAGTLEARHDSSPCADRGMNIVCAGFMGGQGAKAGGLGYSEETSPTLKLALSGGNTVPDVVCVQQNRGVEVRTGDVCGTLNTNSNASGRNTPICFQATDAVCVDQGGGKSSCSVSEECSPTLATTHGGEPVVALNGDKMGKAERKGGSGLGVNTDNVMHTQTVKDVHAVAYDVSFDVNYGCPAEKELAMMQKCGTAPGHYSGVIDGECVPLDLRNATRDPEKHDKVNRQGVGVGEDGAPMNTVTAASVTGVGWQATVRRLLPVECERLMGFPDNWTRIPWKGKPGEECPDSPRYKACGNSMCVNVMRWIGMRIENLERKINK